VLIVSWGCCCAKRREKGTDFNFSFRTKSKEAGYLVGYYLSEVQSSNRDIGLKKEQRERERER
jgi:hypothetical protein